MPRTRLTLRLGAALGSILLAGALATAGCDSEGDECVGAGCLLLGDWADAGDSGITCEQVCGQLTDYCATEWNKASNDRSPGAMGDCIRTCQKWYSPDQRQCLTEVDCTGIPSCFNDPPPST